MVSVKNICLSPAKRNIEIKKDTDEQTKFAKWSLLELLNVAKKLETLSTKVSKGLLTVPDDLQHSGELKSLRLSFKLKKETYPSKRRKIKFGSI